MTFPSADQISLPPSIEPTAPRERTNPHRFSYADDSPPLPAGASKKPLRDLLADAAANTAKMQEQAKRQ